MTLPAAVEHELSILGVREPPKKFTPPPKPKPVECSIPRFDENGEPNF